ncbi:hypothetical protein FJZ21_02045 [Candidatus Pacearchaeota archaeon]|nr:hypothetical protein [Candidatus Pacearchaeota archaeon]
MSFIKGLKEVYSKSFYIFVALAGVLLFYLIDVILLDFSDLKAISDQGSLKLLFYYFVGYPSTIDSYSNFFLFAIAFLFGSYIALATYKTSHVKTEKVSFFGSVGLFFGLLAPGCAACGVGLASVLGIGGALIALPFNGKEVSIVAFALLLYANFKIAKKINQNTCSISFK